MGSELAVAVPLLSVASVSKEQKPASKAGSV